MSVQPAKYDFQIWKGATFNRRLTYLSAGTGSNPENLTGYTALLEIRNVPEAVTPLFTLSTINSRIILGGSTGTIDLIISAADTATLSWKGGVYDLILTSGGAVATALLQGKFTVRGV